MSDTHIVGTFEAKTHLSALLDRVETGEEIIITRHGKAVARIVPEKTNREKRQHSDIKLIDQIKELRKGMSLGGISWKELRDTGRK